MSFTGVLGQPGAVLGEIVLGVIPSGAGASNINDVLLATVYTGGTPSPRSAIVGDTVVVSVAVTSTDPAPTIRIVRYDQSLTAFVDVVGGPSGVTMSGATGNWHYLWDTTGVTQDVYLAVVTSTDSVMQQAIPVFHTLHTLSGLLGLPMVAN